MKRLALILSLLISTPGLAETPAKQLFGAMTQGSAQTPAAYGSYARGCAAGLVQLPETGPTWQAMRLSRNRNWGHPETISFIQRLSAQAAQIGWNGLYIGDISQPRGGPMLSGHASHQLGLDADIWLLAPRRLDLNATERENISSVSVRSADQRSVNGHWTAEHMAILRAAASDPAVARIFVSGAIKVQMCNTAPSNDRAWLRKIRPWWGHHYHFHVRLNCPEGSPNCTNQDAIPRGDGCEDANWWINEALAPAPPPDPNATPRPPKPEITLSTLPAQCYGVLQSP